MRRPSRTTFRILRALLEEPDADRYGFELIRTTGITSGTLYPILVRLQKHGVLEAHDEGCDAVAEMRPRRVYYRLTDAGRQIAESEVDAELRTLASNDGVHGAAGRQGDIPGSPRAGRGHTGIPTHPNGGSRSTVTERNRADGALFGRDDELAAIGTELARHRLVVLTGPAGVGKTRLARELARGSADAYPDGVHVVELAPVRDPALVEEVVASALGIWEQPQIGVLASVVKELRARHILIVLDNCEHVAEVCARLVSALVDGCPNLGILATSQVRLEAVAAAIRPVPPLPLPGVDASIEAMTDSPAVSLFCARAAAAKPTFTAGAETVRVVAEICRRLDGIPLAIELAAARVVVLSPAEVADRLDRRFLVLKGGASPGFARHATLRLALDWSHDLLTGAERLLLRRLSVFVGPCDIDAVDAVCGEESGEWSVLDPLTGLISKSLVHADTDGSRARYSMLETIRLYAADRLEEAGEVAAIRRRHAAWFLGLAERVEPQLTGPDQGSAVDELAEHHDDLRAALTWSIGEGQIEVAMRLAGALTLFWRIRGLYREGHDFHAAAANVAGQVSRAVAFKSTWGHGFMALMRDARPCSCGLAPPHEESQNLLDVSLGLAEALEDLGGQARALLLLGNRAYCVHDRVRARELLQRSGSLAAEVSDTWCWSHALGMEARVLVDEGDLPAARALIDRCLAIARQARDLQGMRLGLNLLGEVEVAVGNYAAAESAIDEALSIGRRLGEPYLIQGCLHLLAEIKGARGDRDTAGALVQDAWRAGERTDQGPTLQGTAAGHLGELALDEGDTAAAAGWFDRVCELLDSDGKPPHSGLAGLGQVAALEGREADAYTLLARARALAGARADRDRAIASLTARLGRLARDRGDRPRAVSLHCQALETFLNAGFVPGAVQALEDLGALRFEAGKPEEAAGLLGAAHALREQHGYARAPILAARHAADAEAVRAALDPDRFDAAWTNGAGLSLAAATALALKGWGPRPRSASGWDSLTRAEREIVGLVREGLSNRDIAARLFISPRTVGGHLVHIYAKLGIRSRAKLAVDAGLLDA